jgi:hypothetical protein
MLSKQPKSKIINNNGTVELGLIELQYHSTSTDTIQSRIIKV